MTRHTIKQKQLTTTNFESQYALEKTHRINTDPTMSENEIQSNA